MKEDKEKQKAAREQEIAAAQETEKANRELAQRAANEEIQKVQALAEEGSR